MTNDQSIHLASASASAFPAFRARSPGRSRRLHRSSGEALCFQERIFRRQGDVNQVHGKVISVAFVFIHPPNPKLLCHACHTFFFYLPRRQHRTRSSPCNGFKKITFYFKISAKFRALIDEQPILVCASRGAGPAVQPAGEADRGTACSVHGRSAVTFKSKPHPSHKNVFFLTLHFPFNISFLVCR